MAIAIVAVVLLAAGAVAGADHATLCVVRSEDGGSINLLPVRVVGVVEGEPGERLVAELQGDETACRVARVRTIRPIKVDPPWPELQESIIAAVREWTYEPTCVDGHPVKVELTLSVRVEFR